jgi:GNAT superfamily N-acetyltransferase
MKAEADDVSIRLYRTDDRDDVCRFSCPSHTLDEDPVAPWDEGVHDAIRNAPIWRDDPDDDTLILVAVDASGRIVGVIAAGLHEIYGELIVFGLGVVPDRRRLGIGIDLKMTALAEMSERAGGPIRVYSFVHEDNDPMNQLNEKINATREDAKPEPEYWLWQAAGEIMD